MAQVEFWCLECIRFSVSQPGGGGTTPIGKHSWAITPKGEWHRNRSLKALQWLQHYRHPRGTYLMVVLCWPHKIWDACNLLCKPLQWGKKPHFACAKHFFKCANRKCFACAKLSFLSYGRVSKRGLWASWSLPEASLTPPPQKKELRPGMPASSWLLQCYQAPSPFTALSSTCSSPNFWVRHWEPLL